MQILHGKGVSGGVAIGRARQWQRRQTDIRRQTVHDRPAEWRRYEAALNETVQELQGLYERSAAELGQSHAQIFSVHAMMAQDEDLNDLIRQKILFLGINAECAVSEAAEYHESVFSGMEDAYMRERAGDVRDIADRILRHLGGTADGELPLGEKRGTEGAERSDVICADDLSPSETVQLDRRRVGAFVTAKGSSNSHTAILARTMHLPAVVGLGEALMHIREDMLLAVDGDAGTVYLDPDPVTLRHLQLRIEQEEHRRERLSKYCGRESRTLDGHRVEICANVGSMADVSEAIANDADGIGLFRSEFLYLQRDDFPDEEEQFAAYCRVLRAMPDRRVVVRTLDIGADKQAAYFGLAAEENPALGMRAVRISLTRPQIFMTQARALLRASHYGNLAVMFPMITSESEVRGLLALWERAKEQLREEQLPYSDRVEIGIMIETPAAALISDRLAPMVDFFSIGTNDLTQYTLAIDRQNAALDPFCDVRHEAVMRLIRMTAESARRAGIWVGICGELGADLDMTEELLRLGMDEFSVAPPNILPLRERVCTTRVATVKEQKQEEKAK